MKKSEPLNEESIRESHSCSEESMQKIRPLIDTGASTHAQDQKGALSAALITAASRENLLIIKLLLDAGADVNAPAQTGRYGTALVAAAERGDLKIVKLLLDAGANVNAPAQIGDYGTALIAAAGNMNAEIVRLLLETGADVNAPAQTGAFGTALIAATGSADEKMSFVIKLLLRVDKIANVREGLYFYRCGQSSTMNNHNARKNLDIIRIMEELREPLAAAGRTADFETLLINHLLLDTINRVAVQDSPDKGQVCAELRAYAKKYIPRLLRCPSFQKESRNRRIVLFLNYHGLEGLSRLLLQAKKTAAQ